MAVNEDFEVGMGILVDGVDFLFGELSCKNEGCDMIFPIVYGGGVHDGCLSGGMNFELGEVCFDEGGEGEVLHDEGVDV